MLNKDELTWMRHAVQMASYRLHELRRDADPQLRASLIREVELRTFVMDHIHQPAALRGAARVWFDYMLSHAQLQIRRYAWQINETNFRELCSELRSERDRADRKAAGQPWIESKIRQSS